MREVLLFSQSQALIRHWIEIAGASYRTIEDESDFYSVLDRDKNQIIFYDLQSFKSIFTEVVKEAQLHDAKLFALTGAPSFEEGSQLLPKGICGYANSYMSKENFLVALEVIESGQVWLYPEFIQALIQQAAKRSSHHIDRGKLFELTPKELEVAQYVAKGKSNKEIAIALVITERTVKAHLTHIYEKLNISDRLSLALMMKEDR